MLSNKFCCCLPVRLGVLVLSILGMAVGLFVVIAGTVKIFGMHADSLALNVQIFSYALLTIFSICGLVGAIARHRGFILIFSWCLFGHLIFSIGSGIYSLAVLFTAANDDIQTCANDVKGPSEAVTQACTHAVTVFKNVAVVMSLLVWLIEIYAIVIVRSYGNQLSEERQLEAKMRDVERGSSISRRVPPPYQPPAEPSAAGVDTKEEVEAEVPGNFEK